MWSQSASVGAALVGHDGVGGWDQDAFDGAFLDERDVNLCRVEAQIVAPEQIDDVVEVPGPSTLGHRAQFLGEQFLEGVAAYLCWGGKGIGVRVSDIAQDRWPDNPFVGRDVEFDPCR